MLSSLASSPPPLPRHYTPVLVSWLLLAASIPNLDLGPDTDPSILASSIRWT